jgi:hypothetical protein
VDGFCRLVFGCFFFIGANGAADARNYLKGGLETAVYSTTHEKTYLVRALTAGAIVIHPNLTELAFIPKERIQYFSTVAKVNRIFDPKYWLRELRR